VSQNTNPNQSGWLSRFAFGRPVLFSLLVILITGLLTDIPLHIILEPWVGSPDAIFWEITILHSLTGLLLVGLLVRLGLLKRAGFTPPGQWKVLWVVWPLAILTLLNFESLLSGSLVIDPSRPGLIVLYIIRNLAIGFCEEVMGRGVVLMVMLQKWGQSRRGTYRAVLIANALFGVSHIFNLLAGRLPPLASLAQVVYSFVFGVAFAACFLRNNAIWPVMVMHAMIDMGSGLRHIAVGGAEQIAVVNTTWAQVAATLVVSLPLLLYSLFILRRVRPSRRHYGAESMPPQDPT
jgi:membrane protease YdiL (CAAX protease family)